MKNFRDKDVTGHTQNRVQPVRYQLRRTVIPLPYYKVTKALTKREIDLIGGGKTE